MKSQMRVVDVLRSALMSLRHRRLRAALSILGVSIGIAAVVAVLGITTSSQAELLDRLDRMGTDLLTVTPGQTIGGGSTRLPLTSASVLRRTDWVEAVAPTAIVARVGVYRSDQIPDYLGGGLSVIACDPSLSHALGTQGVSGAFLNDATARQPVVVLGYAAAVRLGIPRVGAPTRPTRIALGDQWFTVGGVIAPVALAPELDNAALIGLPVASRLFGFDGHPTTIYVRTDPAQTARAAQLLARASNPRSPQEVAVSRPSDVLTARLAVVRSTTELLLGLGVVAVVAGGVGIANTMVIGVLERRVEIGLRRALGATRRHIAQQFVVEAILLCLSGGLLGVVTGALVTYIVAAQHGWQPTVPPAALWSGLGAAFGVGVVAGLLPAIRAARLAPTDALRAT